MNIKDSFYYTPYQTLKSKNISFADFSKKKNYYNQLSFLFEEACSRNLYTKKEVDFLIKISDLYLDKKPIYLDMACGTGRHSRILSKKGLKVFGIDASDKLLKVAKENDKLTIYKKADFRKFSVIKNVDCIFSFWEAYNYLSGAKDISSFLNNCYRTLNKNGILILDSRNFWNKNAPKEKIQNRKFKTKDLSVDLIIKKRTLLKEKIHEGIFVYIIKNIKNGIQNIIVDQELVKVWEPKELMSLSKNKFKLIEQYGDFNISKKYKKDTSDRMILVFQKI